MPKNQDDSSVLLSLRRHILTQRVAAPSLFSKNRKRYNIENKHVNKMFISEYSEMSADKWKDTEKPIAKSALIVKLILFSLEIDLSTRYKLGKSIRNNPAISWREKIALIPISLPSYAISVVVAVVRAPINLALSVYNKSKGASPKSNASEQDPLTKNFSTSTNTKKVDEENVQFLEKRQSTSCEAPESDRTSRTPQGPETKRTDPQCRG